MMHRTDDDDGGVRVFFHVHGLGPTVYKLKLAPHSAFKYLLSHLPLRRDAGPPLIQWQGRTISPAQTPADYGMPSGDQHVQELHVVHSTNENHAGGGRSASDASSASSVGSSSALPRPTITYFARTARVVQQPSPEATHPATVQMHIRDDGVPEPRLTVPLYPSSATNGTHQDGTTKPPPGTIAKTKPLTQTHTDPAATPRDLPVSTQTPSRTLSSIEDNTFRDLRKENEDLRKQLRKLELSHAEATQAAADSAASNELETLRRNAASLDAVVAQRDAAERRAAEAESRLATLQHELEGLRRFSEKQSAEFTSVTAELATLKTEYVDSVTELRQQIDSLSIQNEALQNESANASRNAIRFAAQLKTLSEKAAADAATAATARDLEAAMERKEADINKWQRTATELNATVQSLRSEVAGCTEKIARLNRDLEVAHRDVREADRRAEEVKARERRQHKEDIEHMRLTVGDMEASLLECNRLIVELRQDNMRLRRAVIEVQQELIEAQASLHREHSPIKNGTAPPVTDPVSEGQRQARARHVAVVPEQPSLPRLGLH